MLSGFTRHFENVSMNAAAVSGPTTRASLDNVAVPTVTFNSLPSSVGISFGTKGNKDIVSINRLQISHSQLTSSSNSDNSALWRTHNCTELINPKHS